MAGNTTYDSIAQDQSKKVSSNKPADSTYIINTSDGNHMMVSVLRQNKFTNNLRFVLFF